MLNVYPDPAGFRKAWWDTAIRAGDASVLEAVIDNYGTWVQENMADKGPDVMAVLLIIPISRTTIAQFQKNGGNSLGVDADTPTQIKINTYVTWSDPAMDDAIGEAGTKLVGQTERIAKDAGAFDGGVSQYSGLSEARGRQRLTMQQFIYMNYAERTQDVFERRGADTIAHLKAVSEKYDPDDVLLTQWKGFFKISEQGSPEGSKRVDAARDEL